MLAATALGQPPSGSELLTQTAIGNSPVRGSLADSVRANVKSAQQVRIDLLSGVLSDAVDSQPVLNFIEQLRTDLRSLVTQQIRSTNGSQVQLAVLRAATRERLEVLNHLERAFGEPIGPLSTRWNIFTKNELVLLDRQIRDEHRRLLIEAGRYSETAIPLEIRGRLYEVATELDSLVAELALRGDREHEALRDVPSDLTLGEAKRRIPAIAAEPDAVRAERILLGEVEQGLNWHPQNVMMRVLAEAIHRGPYRATIFARIQTLTGSRAQPDGWPPPRNPPPSGGPSRVLPPDGPLPPPSGGSVSELARSAQEELAAVKSGDTIGRAEAISQRAVHARYTQLVTGTPQDPRQLSLAAMDNAGLQTLRDGYLDWQKGLLETKARSTPAQWFGEAELNDTRAWLEALDQELTARRTSLGASAGLHGPEQIGRPIGGPPPPDGPEIAAFRDTAMVTLERERLVALHVEIDNSPPPPETRLERAYEAQQARVLEAEAQTLNDLHARSMAATTEILIKGRGEIVARGSRFSAEAQSALRAQAQALQREIVQTRAVTTSPEAQLRLTVRIDPALLAPPPIEGPYQAEALQRIALAVRGAKGTTSLPRAPPIRVGMPASSGLPSLRLVPEVDSIQQDAARRLAGSDSFEQLFTESTARSHADLIRDIRRAPGGVIVDVKLDLGPDKPVRAPRYEVPTGILSIEVGGVRLKVEPSPSPLVARAALAFVLDGRVAAADIRPASNEVREKFLLSIPPERLDFSVPGQDEAIRAELRSLREVNLHPALADTTVGIQLIAVDEMIFDALGAQPILLANESIYHGLSVGELRRQYDEDLTEIAPTSGLFLKSIVSVTQTQAKIAAGVLQFSFPLSYAIYYLPEQAAAEPRPLRRAGSYLSGHDKALQDSSPELAELTAFAAAVAIFRGVSPADLSAAAAGLAAVEEETETPRFLCRAAEPDGCRLPHLRHLLQ